MVMVYQEIKDAVENNRIHLEPYEESFLQPNSIDVTLGNEFCIFDFEIENEDMLVDPYKCNDDLMTFYDSETFIIYPHSLVLGTTREYIELPDDICAEITGKSSLARLGLSIHQTGGWIDCGFRGQITLEMVNNTNYPILLHEKMPIAQLIFHETSECDVPYHSKDECKYLDQSGVVTSKYYMNES